MAVLADIAQSLTAPRLVIRRKLGQGQREDRALGTAMGACLLLFVAQWPILVRSATLDPSVGIEARIGGALMALLFVMPLILYTLAAASHLIAKAFGGRGSFYAARLALFWALLAGAPYFLLHGLIAGYLGQGAALWAGTPVLGLMIYLWMSMLIEAES